MTKEKSCTAGQYAWETWNATGILGRGWLEKGSQSIGRISHGEGGKVSLNKPKERKVYLKCVKGTTGRTSNQNKGKSDTCPLIRKRDELPPCEEVCGALAGNTRVVTRFIKLRKGRRYLKRGSLV